MPVSKLCLSAAAALRRAARVHLSADIRTDLWKPDLPAQELSCERVGISRAKPAVKGAFGEPCGNESSHPLW